MKFDKVDEKSKEILREIQASVPKEWFTHLLREEYTNPTIREMILRADQDPDLTPEQRQKIDMLKGFGVHEQKTEMVDPVVAELIDAYTAKEIVKAITAKRLKRGRRTPRWETVSKRYNLAKQAYDKRFEK